MGEEKGSVETSILEEKENISAEPKDEIIKILTEMKQEQQKSNNIIKKLFIELIIFLIPTIITIMSFIIHIYNYLI